MKKEKSTYSYKEIKLKHGIGSSYRTACCNNEMLSIFRDPWLYHGKLCPRCFQNGKNVALYLEGTEEAKAVEEG